MTMFRKASEKLLGPAEPVLIGYTDWGGPRRDRVLVCLHGLTRQGRDFDELARALEHDRRIVCPDMVGRGTSTWLGDKSGYGIPRYVAHCRGLLAELGLSEVDWLGTSMGGIVGMALAADDDTPIRRLILNDVGAFVPGAAIAAITREVGTDPTFHGLGEVVDYLRRVHAGFGPLDDRQWSEMAQHSVMREPRNVYRLHYDPAIGDPFHEGPVEDLDLWPVWSAVRCPTLLLRGADSPVLTVETARAMCEGETPVTFHEIAECGHAPSLMTPAQIALVAEWLACGDSEAEEQPRSRPRQRDVSAQD